MDQRKRLGLWKPVFCKIKTQDGFCRNLPIVTVAVVTFITKQEQNPKWLIKYFEATSSYSKQITQQNRCETGIGATPIVGGQTSNQRTRYEFINLDPAHISQKRRRLHVHAMRQTSASFIFKYCVIA